MDQSWAEIEKRVKTIISEHLGIDSDKVTLKAGFIDDLGADSLDTVELVMAFEEAFGGEISDDAAIKIQTVADLIDWMFSIYSKDELKDIDLTATVIAFRVREDGKIEVGLKGTDGSWVFADGTKKLPTGIYLTVFNRWGDALKELEEIVNDDRAKESDLQRFFESYPELLKGDEYDKIVPQAVIIPDDRKVNWRADFVLHPYDQVNFCKIVELKLPSELLVKADRSGHSNFYYNMHKAVQQLRDYRASFGSMGTRENFHNAYGINVFKPDLELVIGRKWDVDHIGVMLERQRRDSLGIVDWDTMVEKLRRKFT
jgi:acyl carrier protein